MSKFKKSLDDGSLSLKDKTVAISGATGGLGRELCRRLCMLGAELILLDRNRGRSEALISELSAEFAETVAEHITLDLEDIERVKAVADMLVERGIDYLILNAGAYSIPRHKCSTGFDNVYQINFVSPYYLARRLLPTISKRGGRLVAVGSIAHNYSNTDPDDVDFSTRKAASKVYGNAKRYLMFSLMGLEEKSLTVTHPGITVTNITAHYPKLLYAIIKYPMKLIFTPPRRACLSILMGLFESCEKNEWIGPRLFDIWGAPKKKRLRTCSDVEAAEICRTAEAIYGELCQKTYKED